MASTIIKSIGSTGSISQAGQPYQVGEIARIRITNVIAGEYADRVIIETAKGLSFELDISDGVTIDGVLFSGTTTELVDALGAVFFNATGAGEPSSEAITSLDMGLIS